MTVTITPVDNGTVAGDGTGESAFDAFESINANEAALKAAVEALHSWTKQNSTLDPLVVGTQYFADNHAGITYTCPATFATADAVIVVSNQDDASSITLTPASGDQFYINNAGEGVDATVAITAGNGYIIEPRTANSEWDLIPLGGAGGGWADMTEAVWAGGTQSEVADGASAVAFDFDTDNTYSTAGANLARWSNNGTPVIDLSFQGGIDHVNSGASTAAHSQSLNLNWAASGVQTSSGLYSVVIGANCTADSTAAVAIGQSCQATYANAVAMGSSAISSSQTTFAVGTDVEAATNFAIALGAGSKATNYGELALATSKISARGDAQGSTIIARIATTDATQTALKTGNSWGFPTIPADTTWCFTGLVVARSDETDGNLSCGWKFEGVLYRDESNNTVIQGVTVTNIYDGASAAWSVAVEADDTNEALAIKVTGEAATNIRWVAKVDIAQVSYA